MNYLIVSVLTVALILLGNSAAIAQKENSNNKDSLLTTVSMTGMCPDASDCSNAIIAVLKKEYKCTAKLKSSMTVPAVENNPSGDREVTLIILTTSDCPKVFSAAQKVNCPSGTNARGIGAKMSICAPATGSSGSSQTTGNNGAK